MKSQRQIFTLPLYTTVAGRSLKQISIGYETYGQLNAAGDNAILVCHFFSGTAHAAGRYEESDLNPGWWDSLIGPGKALDTDRYFVISSDTLCCIKVFDGKTVTTGPASIDPDSGQPYGLDFPIPDMRDLVRVQKALLDHLGINQLVAVAGPSAGSAQAIEWATEFPHMVPRVLAAISPGLTLHPYARSLIECWASPIRVDAAWQGGCYPLDQQPMLGLIEAYRQTNVTAISHDWSDSAFGSGWADPTRDPQVALTHEFKTDAGLTALAKESARTSDANHFLYMARLCGTYNVLPRIAQARAKFLFLPAESDLLFPPFMSETAVAQIREAGGRAELALIRGNGGHFDGLTRISESCELIQQFLTSA